MAKLHVEFGGTESDKLEMSGSVIEMFSLLTFVLWEVAKESDVPFDKVRQDFIELLSRCDTSLLKSVETNKE